MNIGALAYLDNGRLAMAGWMRRPHGDMATLTPAEFNRLARAGARMDIPRAWLNAIDTGFNGIPRLDPLRVPRVKGPAVTFGGKWANGGWYTFYFAQTSAEPRLRALINRVEPQAAARVTSGLIRDMHGQLSGACNTCPRNSRPLMSTLLMDDMTYTSVNRYFKNRGMPRQWCCGGPAIWILPELSASSVSIAMRTDDVSDNADACVSSG